MKFPSGLTQFYKCLEDYGEDRFLCAFQVKDVSSGKEFVLRTPAAGIIQDDSFRAEFSAFFQKCTGIRPINIPKFGASGARAGVSYVLEQCTKGTPLGKGLAPKQILAHIGTVCNALQLAHQQDVRHLCVRPSDILISADGPKLTGFGLEIFVGIGKLEDLSENDKFFIAPEVLAPNPTFDKRSDVFSLGSTVVRLIPELANHPVIKKATHLDPNERYAAIMQVKTALSEIDLSPPSEVKVVTDTPGVSITMNGLLYGICPHPEGISIPVNYPIEITAKKGTYEKTVTITSSPPNGVISLDMGRFVMLNQPVGAQVLAQNLKWLGWITAAGLSVHHAEFPVELKIPGYGTHILATPEAPCPTELKPLVVRLSTNPPGAEIRRDGQTLGSTQGGPLQLSWMIHKGAKLEILHPDCEPAEYRVPAMCPHRDVAETIELRAAPTTVRIVSDPPRASVYDESGHLGDIPEGGKAIPFEAGRSFTVRKFGYKDASLTMSRPGELRVKLEPVKVSVTTKPGGAVVKDRATGQTIGPLTDESRPVVVEYRDGCDMVLEKDGHEPEPFDRRWWVEDCSRHIFLAPGGHNVWVTSFPNEAEVYVDDQYRGRTPLEIGTAGRDAEIKVKALGYVTQITHIQAGPPPPLVNCVLEKAPVTIKSAPEGANVLILATPYGLTGPHGIDVPWDKGSITVMKEGYKPVTLHFEEELPPDMEYVATLEPVN